MTSGLTPAPMTTASAGISRPHLVTTVVTRPSAPSKRSSSSSPCRVMPCPASRSWKYPAASRPKVRLSARSSSITIVQSLPSSVSVAATSEAM